MKHLTLAESTYDKIIDGVNEPHGLALEEKHP